MTGPSWSGVVSSGLSVTCQIDGAVPTLPDYPLLPGDLLIERADGTFGKIAPGLGIEGIRLTDEQRDSLEVVEDVPVGIGGLAWFLSRDES